MLDIVVRRLRRFPVRRGAGLPPKQLAVVQAELVRLGIEVDREVLQALHPSWATHWPVIRQTLAELRGDQVSYVPLFKGFPDEVPDDEAYFVQRLLGYLGVDTFDRSSFGADPITQRYDAELFATALLEQSTRPDGSVQTLAFETLELHEVDAALTRWASARLEATSSIPEVERADLQRVLVHLGADAFDLDRIGQKETAALVLSCFWRAGDLTAVRALAKTPTDLLRLFAALTDTDVSLSSVVRFPRFTRAQRRCVLQVLDDAPRLADDLLRFPGLWKSVARSLHTREYTKRFPRVVDAIQRLRAGELRSWESVTEAKLRHRDVSVLRHLAERPGSFARRLHQLVRLFDSSEVLLAFDSVADQVPTKILLSLHAHFSSIEDDAHRAIVTKKGRIKVLPNPHQHALGPGTVAPVLVLLEQALLRALSNKASWAGKTVWLHPRLQDYTVPLQLRSASDGLLSLGRGSRVPVGEAAVIRLFVWWRQRARDTDLDLSAVTFDADFNYLGHVSYTQLSGQGMAHSGDMQSTGPEGASEFIDLDLAALSSDVAYIAPQIHRYSGESLDTVEAHAGWMLREAVDGSYAGFDPATVQNKFVVCGLGSFSVPFLLDVRSREIVLIDLYVGNGAWGSNSEGTLNGLSLAARAVADFTRTRPDLRTLAELHVRARGGTLTDDPAADITFGIDKGTFQAEDPVGCLANLL